MAAIPPNILTPEAAAPFAVGALHALGHAHRDWGSDDSFPIEVLGNIRNAPFEGYFPQSGFLRDDVALSAHHVDHDVGCHVLLDFCKPSAHFEEATLVQDAVDQDNSACATIVQLRYAAKPFLTRRIPQLQSYCNATVHIQHSLGQE